jgi:hypothetical protein
VERVASVVKAAAEEMEAMEMMAGFIVTLTAIPALKGTTE